MPGVFVADIRLYTTADLMRLPPQRWLIKGLLPEMGQSLLFGPPGEGKSFVGLSWALCVSTGRPWLGYPVRQGQVVYIAAEGGRGIKKRVAAWMQHHDVPELPDIHFVLDAVDIRAEGAVEQLIELLDAKVVGKSEPFLVDGEWVDGAAPLALVVVDTLSRSFGGEEENDSSAMSSFVEKLEVFSKSRGAAVLTIHHTNATGARERGHTSLKGAMEASFKCTSKKDGGTIEYIALATNKQKDDADEPTIYLGATVVTLPPDGEAEAPTSLVLMKIDPPEAETKAGGAAKAAIRVEDMLTLLGIHDEGLTFNEWRLVSKIPMATFARRLAKLKRDSLIHKNEIGRYVVTGATKDLADLGDDE